MNDVTVRDPLIRTSLEINDASSAIARQDAGRPSDCAVALALGPRNGRRLRAKAQPRTTPPRARRIAQKLLAAQIAADSERRLKELRDRAVIVKASP